MSDPTALGPEGAAGWLQLFAGVLLLLAPGVAAADRLVGLRRYGWAWAPVFSFTVLPLGAIVLDALFGTKVTPGMTVLIAVVSTGLFGRTHLLQLVRWLRSRSGVGSGAMRPVGGKQAAGKGRGWRHGLLVAGVLVFVAVCQSIPHLPGSATSTWGAYPTLGGRLLDAAAGQDYPYPVHVDESMRMAQQAQIERGGRVDYAEPFTGQAPDSALFSVAGFREEHGFNLAMVQLHELTGLSLAAQTRWLPAVAAAVTAACLYALLAPSRGALIGAGLVAAIPSSARFLGPGVLVPSSFALPWILLAIHLAIRASGPRRLGGLALVLTGAFFMHLVIGTLALASASVATLVRPARLLERLAMLSACVLPLLWVAPLVASDAVAAVSARLNLPFVPGVFLAVGWPILTLAAVGMALSFLSSWAQPEHKALAWMVAGMMVVMAVSVGVDFRSDATFGRLLPFFFLGMASLAGFAIGHLDARWLLARFPVLGRLGRSAPTQAGAGAHAANISPLFASTLVALVAILALQPAVASQLNQPFYRVHDASSWEDAALLRAAGADASSTFLADPWQAPFHNVVTGAKPYAVLYPGAPPVHDAAWQDYVASGGKPVAWLQERGIEYVVGLPPINGTYQHFGGHVYVVQ